MISPPTEIDLLQHRVTRAEEDVRLCRAAAAIFPFRAGDVVKHAPSGETWTLACDQEDDDVFPAGWPETRASAAHCRLVRAASDTERLEMLRMAGKPHPEGGRRHQIAAHQLAREPVQIQTHEDADRSFGAGTRLANLAKAALNELADERTIVVPVVPIHGERFFDPGPSRYDYPPEEGS